MVPVERVVLTRTNRCCMKRGMWTMRFYFAEYLDEKITETHSHTLADKKLAYEVLA